MNATEAYLQTFNVLSSYYHTVKLDGLGSMLGDMNPGKWKISDGGELVSADPAIYACDWQDAWNRIVGEGKDATEKQVFDVAKILLNYYQNTLGYKLGDAEEILRKVLLSESPSQLAS